MTIPQKTQILKVNFNSKLFPSMSITTLNRDNLDGDAKRGIHSS